MESNGRKVPIWLIVVLLVGVFTTLFGWILVSINKTDAKVEAYRVERDQKLDKYQGQILDYNEKIDEMRQLLGSVKTDVEWLKKNI